MKIAIYLCILVSLLAGCAVAEVSHYAGTVRLDPVAGELKADMNVTLTAGDKPESEHVFYLNKGLNVEAVECKQCAGYTYDTAKLNQLQFVQNGVPLTVKFKQPLEKGKKVAVQVRYSGHIVPDSYGVNPFSPDWTELALYSGWYPVDPASNSYSFSIHVQMDPAFRVSGNADVKGKPGDWLLVEEKPGFDMVLVAARDLKTQTLERGGMRLRIDSAGKVDEKAVAEFASAIADIVSRYTQWYGPSGMTDARFVLHKRPTGGGYVRSRFMSMPYSAGDSVRGVAHEVGHFWWTGAPVNGWDDWLNEGFAEYSSLRYVRDVVGKEAFSKMLEEARKNSANKPAIWGIARSSPEAYEVLYFKGALRLFALEERIGAEKFDKLLSTMHREHVRNTGALLDLLERQASSEVRQSFEKTLKD